MMSHCLSPVLVAIVCDSADEERTAAEPASYTWFVEIEVHALNLRKQQSMITCSILIIIGDWS